MNGDINHKPDDYVQIAVRRDEIPDLLNDLLPLDHDAFGATHDLVEALRAGQVVDRKVSASRTEIRRVDEQGPGDQETLEEAAVMYRYLRPIIEGTMVDSDRWDGDEDESFHLGRYVQWLAAERATVRNEELIAAADHIDNIPEISAAVHATAELRRLADGAGWPHPRRGDAFEAWLRKQRDAAADHPEAYQATDGLLDLYRLHADTGTFLSEHVCEGRISGDCECLESARVNALRPEGWTTT